MTVEDYAKYVINNITRATIGNALKISDKLDTDNNYKFLDFINYFSTYICELNKDGKLNNDKFYSIMYIINNCINKYNSNINYNKRFIINDFIIDFWKIMEGI